MRYSVTVAQQQFTLDVEQDDHQQWRASLNGQPLVIDQAQVGVGHFSLRLGDRSYEVFVRPLPGEGGTDTKNFDVVLEGQPRTVEVVDERRHALAGLARARSAKGEVTMKAPMPGLVAAILVAPGDHVERGQRVVVLEAMKMQNDLLAPRAGSVRAVKTAQGQAVTQNQPLIVIGDPEGQAEAEPEEDEG